MTTATAFNAALKRFQDHAATLPTTRDLVHICHRCSQREQRYVEQKDILTGLVHSRVHCAACGRTTELGLKAEYDALA